jgi:hypothetical protein
VSGDEYVVHGTDAEPEDWKLPPGTVLRRFRVRCACGTRHRNLRVTENAVAFFRGCSPPPGLIVLSLRCEDCKEAVAITAKQMGFAA